MYDGDDQIQISCAVWLRKMENLAMNFLLSVINRKALAPVWHPLPPSPEPSFKTFITLLPVTFSQIDPQLRVLVVVCLWISVMQKKTSALNRTFSTELYRKRQKSINILKYNGLFLKNKKNFKERE